MHPPTPAPPVAPLGQPDHSVATGMYACIAVLASLTLVKHLAAAGIGGSYGYTAVAALELYLPLYLTRRDALQFEWLGVHARGLAGEIALALGLALLVLPFFALGHHYYQTWFFHRTFALRMPEHLATMIVTHTFAIALPEEMFYRGYLQRRWPPTFTVLGVPLGKATIVVASLFALGHFLGDYNPLRLGPFFPALVFSWLRNRKGSLWGAVTFHAAANIMGEVLYAFYSK